ncbi:MAG: TetR/AcrR family transcriptional regulator [Solirubrobacteraceae bacterium MAG38_C4-C5]|nr:TetR/AcrR family transcriptional regulator [Candidatus Siliceabacter maunaloa]
MTDPLPVPRGRHAPPLEVRLEVQRQRLFDAATAVFVRLGYAEASAEAISREAGMSKATFYEHFANKEECVMALVDHAMDQTLIRMLDAARRAGDDWSVRHRAGVRAFLELVESAPDTARVALIEVVGAGPRALERRDRALEIMAQSMYEDARRGARDSGFATVDDAYACVGAIFELTSRQLRRGHPPRMGDLEPIVERLVLGIVAQSGT